MGKIDYKKEKGVKKEKEHNKCVTIRVEKKVNDDWDMIYQSSALLNGTKLYYTSEDSKERQHFESSWNPWADDATIWHCFIIICQFTYPLWGRVLFISSELQPVIRCFFLASYNVTEDNNGFKKFFTVKWRFREPWSRCFPRSAGACTRVKDASLHGPFPYR